MQVRSDVAESRAIGFFVTASLKISLVYILFFLGPEK